MGRGDPKSGTRWPRRKNRNSCPGRDVLVRDGGPGVGLAGHRLLPHEPTFPLNSLDLLFYSIKYTFRFQKFAYWPVDYNSLPKERNCILRFGAKIGTTSIVLRYSQLLSNTVQNQRVRSDFYLRQPRLPRVTSGGLVDIGTDRYHILRRVNGHWSPLMEIATDVGSRWEKSEFRL